MPSIKKLEVVGYKNQKVPNMYFDFNSNQLAIFLPGLAYTNDSPILHYTGSYFMQKEINILRVDYKYFDNPEYMQAPEDERKQWLVTDVEAVIQAVLSKQKYKKIYLIGKSVGTLALGELLVSTNTNLLKYAEVIWLTPLLNKGELADKILNINNRSLVILGTEDPAYKEDILKKVLEKENIEVYTIEGANHSLEITNNIIESINISEKILVKIIDFIETDMREGDYLK